MSEEQLEEEVQTKPCPFCAGSGKVRDFKLDVTPYAASTSQTVDFGNLGQYNFVAISGT